MERTAKLTIDFKNAPFTYGAVTYCCDLHPKPDIVYKLGLGSNWRNADWKDNCEINYPTFFQTCISCTTDSVTILDIGVVSDLLLVHNYFGNYPMFELPPISMAGIRKGHSINLDAYALHRTWDAVDSLITKTERPNFPEKSLYCAIYCLLAFHNELWLHSCRLLGIDWTPQANFLHKCFYAESDTVNKEWSPETNILMCYKYDFFYTIVAIIWCSWLNTYWGKDPTKVVPFDLLNWKEDEFNNLACIQQLKSKEFEGADSIVLAELTKYCSTLHTFYQRITQTELSECKDDTIFGKIQWLLQATLKLIIVLPYK